MTLLEKLSEFLVGINLKDVDSATIQNANLHILDTIGSYLAGTTGQQGHELISLMKSVGSPKGETPSSSAALLDKVMEYTSVTRYTEMDDIHLVSGTTPGSVIVPTALAFASNKRNNCSSTLFMTSVLAGYEALIRLGAAFDGCRILYKGVWTTYFLAAAGATATAAMMEQFNAEQMARALAIALTTSSNSNASACRPLALGIASRNGALAAFCAKHGFKGDKAILDGDWPRRVAKDTQVDKRKLLGGLGKPFQINNTSFKPFTCGKQSVAAVESFGKILDKGVDPASIKSVRVLVPHHYQKMISGANASAAFRIAIRAFRPDEFYAPQSESRDISEKYSELMKKVSVGADRNLEKFFPKAWPGRVRVKTKDRKTYDETVIYPTGDPSSKNAFGKDEIVQKIRRNLHKSTKTLDVFDAVIDKVIRLPDEASFSSLMDEMNRFWEAKSTG